MATVQAPPNFDAENAGNFEDIEKQFAVKAVMYMQTHWNLLESRRGSELRLTNIDEEIYLDFRDKFPDFDPSQPLDEDQMKGKDKEKWRKFITPYENRVKDFNFGTMLRRDPKTEYGEAETIFAVRMQFVAIEIARNKLGLNDWIYDGAQKSKAT